eukprot:1149402-Pelagomonas_calceolata.AAC.2
MEVQQRHWESASWSKACSAHMHLSHQPVQRHTTHDLLQNFTLTGSTREAISSSLSTFGMCTNLAQCRRAGFRSLPLPKTMPSQWRAGRARPERERKDYGVFESLLMESLFMESVQEVSSRNSECNS